MTSIDAGNARSAPGCAACLVALLAVAAPVPAGAQTGTVEGEVSDAVTGLPIANAQIVLVGTATYAQAGPAGRFSLRRVPAGQHVLEARASGYVSGQEAVTVAVGQTAFVSFALMPGGPDAAMHEAVVAPEVAAQPRMLARSMGISWAPPPGFNTESYAHIRENDFQRVATSPLSTFSIDVDRASYANVRRFVQSGERPPVDAVRIEEMINYFPYDWGRTDRARAPNAGQARNERRRAAESPFGEHPFAVTTEVWNAPWRPEHRLVRIGLHARSVETAHLPPSNLVFLLDVSGSMASPDKLPLLKKAFALLVEQLRPSDRVAIAVYAGAAGLALPSTPGNQRGEILAALEDLRAGGSTAGGEGIRLAYDVARKHFMEGGNNRVILATDGDFNVGASSDAEMVRLIEKQRDDGVFLTVLGFGTGNLKDSKMEQIADHGNGNFHYVDNLLEARKVLVEEMGGTLLTLAKDVKLQVEFNPAQAAGYRLIGYENRLLDDEDFADDAKDAGELGAGHTVTALYEVVPAGTEVPRGGAAEPLRYQPGRGSGESEGAGEAEGAEQSEGVPTAFDGELLYVKVRYKEPDETTSKLLAQPVDAAADSPSDDFRFAAAVAGFGMLLRESPHSADYTLDDVIRLAGASKGADPRGYRGEFVRIVETVRDLGMLDGEEGGERRKRWERRQ